MTFADYANMLKEYFKRDISNEELCGKLFDDTSELLRQLMNLIEADRNISPTLKEKLRLQAKQESLSLFLAEAFLYAIRQKNKSAKTNRAVKAEVEKPSTYFLPQYSPEVYRLQKIFNSLSPQNIQALSNANAMLRNMPIFNVQLP